MKRTIDIFSELGARLRDFGADDASRRTIDLACAANGWFTPAEIRRAVRAITDEMLCRERLAAWLSAYPGMPDRLPAPPPFHPRRVLVIMAGNIPLVGFFDLLCVLVSGHRCVIKPSAKDRVLMEFMVDQLHAVEPALPIEYYDGTSPVDAVIATGSDNANRYFRSRYGNIPSLLRGSRQSVAVLSGRETAEQWAGLSDDIWAYSGLGCRNVSLLFLPRGSEPKLQVTDVNPKYKNNYLQQRALLTMLGERFVDLGSAVLVEQWAFPNALSRIAVAYYDSPAEVSAWLSEHDGELQCVVSESLTHSRVVPFGRAQSPALTDYPDARDVIAWLQTLNG